MLKHQTTLRFGRYLIPWFLGMVVSSLLACQTTTADDDDASSGTDGQEGTYLELAPGTGFDFNTMSTISGVTAASSTETIDQLVVPSDTPCDPPPGHGDPGEFPAACGTVWHLGGASVSQYSSFEDAYLAMKDVSFDELDKSYFFWSVEGTSDLNWAVVFGNEEGEMVLFWLEGVDGDTLQFRYSEL